MLDIGYILLNIIKGNKKSDILPDQVGQAKGEKEIVEEFKKVYENLYNSLDDFEILKHLKEEIEEKVKAKESTTIVNKITGSVVKSASKRLRAGKGDVIGSYTSNAIKNCPDIFFDLTAAVFRSWLTHGTITLSMLSLLHLPAALQGRPQGPRQHRLVASCGGLLGDPQAAGLHHPERVGPPARERLPGLRLQERHLHH